MFLLGGFPGFFLLKVVRKHLNGIKIFGSPAFADNFHFLHHHRVNRFVPVFRDRHVRNGIDHFKPAYHFAENRMPAVEPGGGGVGDEELAAIGPGPCIGHGEQALAVVDERIDEFIGKAVPRAARAGAGGVAALDHEIFDHAVEAEAVVVALPFVVFADEGVGALGQGDEIGHGNRGLVVLQAKDDFALAGAHGCVQPVAQVAQVVRLATGHQCGRQEKECNALFHRFNHWRVGVLFVFRF